MMSQVITYQGEVVIEKMYDMISDTYLLKLEGNKRVRLASEVFREEFRFAVGLQLSDPRSIVRIVTTNNGTLGKALVAPVPTPKPVKVAKPKPLRILIQARTAVIVSHGWGGGLCRYIRD